MLKKLALVAALVACEAAQATPYQLTLLVSPESAYPAVANAINDNGLVVGNSNVFGHTLAAVWDPARGYADNLLPFVGPSYTDARDVNAQGQIVGSAFDIVYNTATGSRTNSRAVSWSADTRSVQILPGQNAIAQAINDSGTIVGGEGNGAARWDGGVVQSLNGYRATDINNAGQIVGIGNLWQGISSGAVVIEGTQTIGFGDYNGRDSEVVATNAQGASVGWWLRSPDNSWQSRWTNYEAVLWSGSAMTVLGSGDGFRSKALDINDEGTVVGFIGTSELTDEASFGVGPNESRQHAASLWKDGTTVKLDDYLDDASVLAGWRLAEARGINNHGQIVGLAYNQKTFEFSAFLLSPVPEPASAAMFLLGLLGLGLVARKQRH